MEMNDTVTNMVLLSLMWE